MKHLVFVVRVFISWCESFSRPRGASKCVVWSFVMGNLCALLKLGNEFEQLGLFSRLIQWGWSALDVVQFSLVSTHAQAWCLLRVSGASQRELFALAHALPDTINLDARRTKWYSDRARIYGPSDGPLWWFHEVDYLGTSWKPYTAIHELLFYCPILLPHAVHRPLVRGDGSPQPLEAPHGAALFPLLDVAVREALRPKVTLSELCKAADCMQGLKRRAAEDEESIERETKRLRLQ